MYELMSNRQTREELTGLNLASFPQLCMSHAERDHSYEYYKIDIISGFIQISLLNRNSFRKKNKRSDNEN